MVGGHALLIGINAYEHFEALEGCVNDVDLMARLLIDTFGFRDEHVRVLRNLTATRDAILAAFDDLVKSAGADDCVVIHFSGYGSSMTDREGDEPSGFDETIVPVDSQGWKGDNRDITDDEIRLRLLEPLLARTSFVTVVLDAGHGGPITRNESGVMQRSLPPDVRPISQLPPSPFVERAGKRPRNIASGAWASSDAAEAYVLIAACHHEEACYEYRPAESGGDKPYGALTYLFARQLLQARPRVALRDIFERTAAAVASATGRKQHPQLEGRHEVDILAVMGGESRIRVLHRDGDVVTLSLGAVHGVAAGARLVLFPDAASDDGSGSQLARVEIAVVRELTSEGRILAGETPVGGAGPGWLARETVDEQGSRMRLRVEVRAGVDHRSEAAALRGAVAASPLLYLVGKNEAADVRVRAAPAGGDTGPSDLVAEAGDVPEPVWVAVTENGRVVMDPVSIEAIAEVSEKLSTHMLSNIDAEGFARYRNALALDNTDASSSLHGHFDLHLLRRPPDGDWAPADLDPATGCAVYEEGDSIAFRITSTQDAADEAAFVHLLDFAMRGEIHLVYPQRGTDARMRPGSAFEIGTQGDSFTLFFPGPDGDPERVSRRSGFETIMLVVSRELISFDYLHDRGLRSGTRDLPSPVTSFFRDALTGKSSDTPDRPAHDVDWMTLVRPFVLRSRH